MNAKTDTDENTELFTKFMRQNIIENEQLSEVDQQALLQTDMLPEELVNDEFDYSQVVVKKPWGYEYLIFENEDVAVWILFLKKGEQTSMHCHPGKLTSLVVLQGEVSCSTLESSLPRKAGEGLLISKKVFHQTKAVSENGAFVMEIETPVNKRDLVRLEDRYGRENMGYEKSDQHSVNTQNYNYLKLSHPVVYHNLKKRFGQCTLTFKEITCQKDWDEILSFDESVVISVLKGNLCHPEKPFYGVGYTTTIRDIERGVFPSDDALILVIQKDDQIIKVSDWIANFLDSQGIHQVFLVPGDANVHLLDSFGRHEKLSYICNQTENGATLAAEAYSKLSGEIGVLVLSSGRSSAEAISGIASAWVDSVPLLVISGQARNDQGIDVQVRQLGNKALHSIEVVRPITKYAVHIQDVFTIAYHFAKAIQIAQQGRPGPVWIDLPIDIQGTIIDARDLRSTNFEQNNQTFQLADSIQQVYTLLRKSKRPVILAGMGIRISKAETLFLQLIEKLGIPVLLSRRGADLLPTYHPLNFGRPGVYGSRSANLVIQNSDLLISIGSRLSIPLIGRNTRAFARGATKVVVDIDPNELNKETVQVDLKICLDAKLFIQHMLNSLTKEGLNFSSWLSRCRYFVETLAHSIEQRSHHEKINPYLFVQALSKLLPEQSVIIYDGASVMNYIMQMFEVKEGQRLISSPAFDLPGFSVPGSIGSSLCEASTPIICICEERGLLLGIQELQTIYEYRLPIKIFSLKSQGNKTIRNIQKDFFGSRFVGTDHEILFGTPNLKEIAQAFRLMTTEILRPEQIETGIQEFLSMPGPGLCMVDTDSNQELIPRMGFSVRNDGQWVAKPLEDMYPFLDRKLLKEMMYIDLLEED